jgi:hypothetical protein
MNAPRPEPSRDEKPRLSPLLLRLLGDGQVELAQQVLDAADEKERLIREAAGRAGGCA